MNARANPPRLVIVGSIGLDTIQTPAALRTEIVGGSAAYAAMAASLFAPTGVVGVVGTDFPRSALRRMARRGVDLRGLQVVPGRTFRWSGVYEENMDVRRTVSTELNVFADFRPELPPDYRAAPYLFLANIAPALQVCVLDQMAAPKLIMADTMDLWIRETRKDLMNVLRRVQVVTLNESEARHLTGEHNLVVAARAILRMGPRMVLVKKGEHGSMLFHGKEIDLLPAYPLDRVRDPTGAGDSFAGGLMGRMAATRSRTPSAVLEAMRYGSVTASFNVEAFGWDRLARVRPAEMGRRLRRYRRMCGRS